MCCILCIFSLFFKFLFKDKETGKKYLSSFINCKAHLCLFQTVFEKVRPQSVPSYNLFSSTLGLKDLV